MGRTAHFLLILIAALLSIMLVFFVGPAVETRFFPTYSRFELASAHPVENGSIVTFRAVKNRDCDVRGWAWYIGEFGSVSRQVEVKPVGSTVIRQIGPFVSEPHLVAAPVEDVRDRMHAEIYSRCHPFWLTRSDVYP